MKKIDIPLIVLVVSIVLIILNFIFESDNMGLGFWLRIISGTLIIIAMFLTIRERKKMK